jgi:hypothetical protein
MLENGSTAIEGLSGSKRGFLGSVGSPTLAAGDATAERTE